MIMIRPNNTTKMGKPPPPVPPRPSKSIVAEALAKTRRQQVPETPSKPTVPIRTAPPPPKTDSISKSKSYTAVSACNNVPTRPSIERSISITEEDKKNTRTVIFQSSQMKTSKIEVNLTRKDSDRMPIQRVNSFKSTTPEPQLESKAEVTLKRKESDRKPKRSDSFNTDNSARKLDDKSNWNDILNDRNHVNTLIDEMFANVLDNASDSDVPECANDLIISNDKAEMSEDKTKISINSEKCVSNAKPIVLVIENTCDESSDLSQSLPAILDDNQKDSSMESKSASSTGERREKRVKFDDKMNHELLVAELQNMHKDEMKASKRERKPSTELSDDSKISHSDWIEVNNGEEVRLSSCQITIEEKNNNELISHKDDLLCRLSAMSNLQGLPPLPKSLSGFSLMEVPQTPSRPGSSRTSTPGSGHMVYPPHPRGNVNGTDIKKTSSLDAQLAILRREMVSENSCLKTNFKKRFHFTYTVNN